MISQIVTEQQLIPAPPPAEGEAADLGGAIYEFEPDEETILARLLPQATWRSRSIARCWKVPPASTARA